MTRRNLHRHVKLSAAQMATLRLVQEGKNVVGRQMLPLHREHLVGLRLAKDTGLSWNLTDRGEAALRGEEVQSYTHVAHALAPERTNTPLCPTKEPYPMIVGVADPFKFYPKVTCRACKVLLGQAEKQMTRVQMRLLQRLASAGGRASYIEFRGMMRQYRVRNALIQAGYVTEEVSDDLSIAFRDGTHPKSRFFTLTDKARAKLGPQSAEQATQEMK